MQILAISGSLRLASLNTALLHAAAALAPEDIEITVYAGLGGLPFFNPDLEGNEPASVMDLRARLKIADGVMIASPEYAHGVTGVIKNALDWLVGGEEFVNKPIALINASPRATHAQAALSETIRTMSGCIISEASISVLLLGKKLDAAGMVSNPEISTALYAAIMAFAHAIEHYQSEAAE